MSLWCRFDSPCDVQVVRLRLLLELLLFRGSEKMSTHHFKTALCQRVVGEHKQKQCSSSSGGGGILFLLILWKGTGEAIAVCYLE